MSKFSEQDFPCEQNALGAPRQHKVVATQQDDTNPAAMQPFVARFFTSTKDSVYSIVAAVVTIFGLGVGVGWILGRNTTEASESEDTSPERRSNNTLQLPPQ